MPINPFARLRPHSKPLRPDVEQALRELAVLGEQHPDLATLATTHAVLLRTAFEDVPQVQPLAMDAAHAATKLAAGVPLLRGETLAFDPAILRERYLRLCDVLQAGAKQSGEHQIGQAAATLKAAVQTRSLDVHDLVMDLLAGDPQRVAQRATAFDLDTGLAATLLRWTLLPILEQFATQLQPLRQQTYWDRGYCPTCGAWPVLAEQRGIEQNRFLRCGLCASDWPIEHFRCPFCNTRAHTDLAYLYAEGQEASRRVMLCERCHCYLKQTTTLAPLPTAMLLVTELATLHLDLVALERAYAPPG